MKKMCSFDMISCRDKKWKKDCPASNFAKKIFIRPWNSKNNWIFKEEKNRAQTKRNKPVKTMPMEPQFLHIKSNFSICAFKIRFQRIDRLIIIRQDPYICILRIRGKKINSLIFISGTFSGVWFGKIRYSALYIWLYK